MTRARRERRGSGRRDAGAGKKISRAGKTQLCATRPSATSVRPSRVGGVNPRVLAAASPRKSSTPQRLRIAPRLGSQQRICLWFWYRLRRRGGREARAGTRAPREGRSVLPRRRFAWDRPKPVRRSARLVGSRAHLRLTRMARPSVSNEIMCEPLGDTAMHRISVRFSHGSVWLELICRSTSITRLPTEVSRWLPLMHRLPPL